MSDHVHVAISIPPKVSVATITVQLKGASSHSVNDEFVAHQSFAWQAEYSVLSFSEKLLSRIVEYVKDQKKHHAENTLDVAMEDLFVPERK
jgi:putative transposase